MVRILITSKNLSIKTVSSLSGSFSDLFLLETGTIFQSTFFVGDETIKFFNFVGLIASLS